RSSGKRPGPRRCRAGTSRAARGTRLETSAIQGRQPEGSPGRPCRLLYTCAGVTFIVRRSVIAEVRAQISLPEKLDEAFKLALARRNSLIHHFMRERAYEFVTAEGRQRMLAELREMQAVALVANGMADEFLMGTAKVLGITPELLESEAEALRKKARTFGE